MTTLASYTLFFFLITMAVWLAYHLRKDARASPLDLITSPINGRLSAAKIGQVIGIVVSTWVIVSLTYTGGLTVEILGIWLLYVGATDGYGKFLRSKQVPQLEDDFDPPRKYRRSRDIHPGNNLSRDYQPDEYVKPPKDPE